MHFYYFKNNIFFICCISQINYHVKFYKSKLQNFLIEMQNPESENAFHSFFLISQYSRFLWLQGSHMVLLILHAVWSLHLLSTICRYFKEIAFLIALSGMNTGSTRMLFMADPLLGSSSDVSFPLMFRRSVLRLLFSYNIINCVVACPFLLQWIRFNVPIRSI